MERRVSHVRDAVRNGNTGEATTVLKRLVRDGSNAAWDHEGSDYTLRALDKCALDLVEQDSIYAAIDRIARIHRYTCKTGTVSERPGSDVGNGAGNGDASQLGAVIERLVINTSDVSANGDICQVGAEPEGVSSNGNDTVGDGDVGQSGTIIVVECVIECISPNARNWQAGDCTWDIHRTSGTIVGYDGDSVIICAVIKGV